ncbi:MAG: TPR end-of-group domain-containing protein [Myxococcota bacterium]
MAALALVSLTAAAATPTLSGLYAVGELGLVDFSMSDGKIVGKLRSSAQCVFVADTPVVTGSFEGNVFVGTVTLCLEGAGCPAQRSFPVLGVHHDDAVAAWIHLDSGCTSPALEDRKLFLRPATVEEKQRVLGNSSASAVAAKQVKGDAAAIAAEAILEGNRLFQDQKFGPAREKFRQAMEADPTRWEAVTGFGLMELKLGFPERALEHFERALTVAGARRASAAQLAQIHYNKACALVATQDDKGAVTSLRQAVKLGGVTLDDLLNDPDLNPLRKDAGFKALVAEVRTSKKPR